VPSAEDLVPRSKVDLATARRAERAGWPAVEPVLDELVDWCLDANWPVAHVLGPFLGQIGPPVVPYVRAVLDGDDAPAKYHAMCGIVDAMEPAVRAELRAPLTRLAHSPTVPEIEEGIPEVALELLADDGLG
jgi:hypothetical protein